jgi:uncharacterized membrane protein
MSNFRCHVCDGIASHYCVVCGRPVCSTCSNDDTVCKRCIALGRDYYGSSKGTGMRIGDIINIPLMLLGISLILIGMMLVSYSMVDMRAIQGDGSNGNGSVIVIFPLPFLIYTSDPIITILFFIAIILLPLILFFIVLKRTSVFNY